MFRSLLPIFAKKWRKRVKRYTEFRELFSFDYYLYINVSIRISILSLIYNDDIKLYIIFITNSTVFAKYIIKLFFLKIFSFLHFVSVWALLK